MRETRTYLESVSRPRSQRPVERHFNDFCATKQTRKQRWYPSPRRVHRQDYSYLPFDHNLLIGLNDETQSSKIVTIWLDQGRT